MNMKKTEELYGKELTRLLSEGMVWIARYSRKSGSHKTKHICNPTQAIIAAALHSLAKQDTEAFSKIHRVENLSYFQYPSMESWLKEDHKFPKKVLVTCLITLAWLVVAEWLSPRSPLVAAIIGLEEKYNICGTYVKAVVFCAKQTWKVAQPEQKNAPEMKAASLETCFEVIESTTELGGDAKRNGGVNPLWPSLRLDNNDMMKILVQGGKGKQKNTLSVKTLLQGAVAREGVNTIDRLMKMNGDVKECDRSISGLINLAAKRKNMKVMRILLWQGLDRNFIDEEGNAPLHIAAASNYLRMVTLLTQAGASVTQMNASGFLPLHLTTDSEVIAYLLEKGTDVDAKTPVGDTALHLAVSNDNIEAVQTLMRFGAKPNAMNTNGLTPILIALRNNNKEMVELLTQRPVVIEKFCHIGEPILKASAKEGLETVNEVSEGEEKRNELSNNSTISQASLSDCSEGSQTSSNPRKVELNYEGSIHNADEEDEVWEEDETGEYWGVVNNNPIEFYVQESSRSLPNSNKNNISTTEDVDEVRETEYYGIVYYNISSERILPQPSEALQDASAISPHQDVAMEPTTDGPIHKAAAEGRLEDVTRLLDCGVDIDVKGDGGYTALQYAAKYGRLNVVRSLVERGADINLGNDWNWSPLHHAAHYSRCDIAKFLLEAGADTRGVDTVYAMTSLMWATNNHKIIQLFQSRGIFS